MRISDQDPPEPEQFERIVEEYSDRVYGIARRITGSDDDAEDALQETFLAVFRGLPRYRGESQLGTWVYRIAVNSALQVRRRRPPSDQQLLDTHEEDTSCLDWSRREVEGEAERNELLRALERGIALLPEEFQAAVILRDVEGFSTSEAADILEVGEAALKSRLHRARLLLRGYLADYLEGR